VLPIKDQSEDCLSKMGDATNDTFFIYIKKYTGNWNCGWQFWKFTIKLNQFSTVIIGYHKSDIAWKDFDFSETELQN
jgi:hypothetical protein